MVDISPCPFCGGTAHVIKQNFFLKDYCYIIKCNACNAHTKRAYTGRDALGNIRTERETVEKVLDRWNNRIEQGNNSLSTGAV